MRIVKDINGWKAAVLVGVLLVAGCGSAATPSDAPDPAESVSPVLEPVEPATLLTPAQTHREFNAAIQDFDGSFPSDFELPDYQARLDRLVAESGSGPVHFEERYAEAEVVGLWMCAWQDRLLTAIEDADEPSTLLAAEQLAGFYDLRAVRDGLFVDEGRNWYTGVVEPALDGELGALHREVKDCREGWLA